MSENPSNASPAVATPPIPTGGTPSVEVRDGVHSWRVPLTPNKLVIGRSPEAEVHLDNASVSRQHAELFRDPFGRWWVRDLGSRNGTLVNGQRIASEHVLTAGDVIQVGGCTVTFSTPAAKPEAPNLGQSGLLETDPAESRISTLSDLEPPRVAAPHLMTLSNLSQQLLNTPDPNDRRDGLCRMMVGEEFHAQSAVILRIAKDRPDDPPQLLSEPAHSGMRYLPQQDRPAHTRAGPFAAEAPYVSRSLLRAVRTTGEAAIASNLWTAPRLSGLGALASAGTAAAIEMSISPSIMAAAAVACPLEQDAQSLDVLYAILPPQYGTGEWLALASLAARQYQQAEQVWRARAEAEAHAALERELQRAHQIQMRLVPEKPAIPGLDLAIGFEPCRWVGGDYVDVVPMADGRVLLVVADVCGKGLGAALVSASLHTMVHGSLDAGVKLRELMRNLNRYLYRTLPGESFVTMVAIAIDPATGQLDCVNAGHPPALVVEPNGDVRELPCGENFPLGCDTAELECHEDQVAAGGLIALYTDGLTEQTDEAGQMVSIAGLREWMKAAYPAPGTAAASAAEILNRRLDALRGKRLPDDDRTFLLARRV